MKKSMKFILGLVISLPLVFSGCQKSDIVDLQNNDDNGVLKNSLVIEYCGDPTIVNLVSFDGTFNPGTVTVGNDADFLYVTYDATSYIAHMNLYVGQHLATPNTYYDEYDPVTGQVHYFSWLFPYIHYPNTQIMTYTFTIPLTDLQSDEGCFLIISHAVIDGIMVSGSASTKNFGWSFDYCLEECDQYDCETAYAYGGVDYANCFIGMPEINTNNWGWSNGPIAESLDTYSWDIYAGAGQCDIDKGTWVGTLDVDYYGGTATVTYNIDADYTLEETHLYVGNEILPRDKKGNYTTAPGQFPYSGETSYTIDGLSGDIYVVAHSVVCGDFEE